MTFTDFSLPPITCPPRDPSRRGRPYRPEVVEAVRALLGTEMRLAEIAARTGVGEATVGRWSRLFRFGTADGGSTSPSLKRRAESREARTVVGRARPDCPPPSGAARLPPPPSGAENASARPGRHPPETREAARAMVEGTRLGLERIAQEFGIGSATLSRWVRRGRWNRPAPPDTSGPSNYRSRTRRGRPYMTDAVETARDLVTGTLLPQKRIAARAGVSQATISIWIRKRGWARPPARPRRFAASARTAPLADSGSRRGRPYAPETVAAARRWFEQTELPTIIIAARVRVTPVTVARWAKAGGWTRPRDIPNPDGSPARRRRRSRRKQVSREPPTFRFA